jgi:hypothetical protein
LQPVFRWWESSGPMAPITARTRDNIISCVVRPIVSICGKEKATVRVFGLKRPERLESVL